MAEKPNTDRNTFHSKPTSHNGRRAEKQRLNAIRDNINWQKRIDRGEILHFDNYTCSVTR